MPIFRSRNEFWWLKPEQQTDDKKKRDKLKKEVFGKEGYKDPYGRFGRGTPFHAPPAGYGDYAFILHIVSSLAAKGRAGIVCPQGVLFRGQPEREEETGEIDANGLPEVKRRKADDEYLIRRALLEAGLIEAVISLPLNVFYGAGVPACLVLLRRDRPVEVRDKVLLIYAGRHYRELSAQNELRPQDVMRILVHYHAHGDSTLVPELCARFSDQILHQITAQEQDEVGRLVAEFEPIVAELADAYEGIAQSERELEEASTQRVRTACQRKIAKFRGQVEKLEVKVADRDRRVADARQRAVGDRADVSAVRDELLTIYSDPAELVKHASLVTTEEMVENEFNLNVPRYVDTFEPEPILEVREAMKTLVEAEAEATASTERLLKLLRSTGYEAD